MKEFEVTINSVPFLYGLHLEFKPKYLRSVDCSVKHVIEGNIERTTKVTGRQGRRREQLLDDLKEKRGYWHLKRRSTRSHFVKNCFGRSYGFVVRQTAE